MYKFLLVNISIVAVAKGFAAITTLLLTAIVTRMLGPEEGGLFLLGLTLLSVSSIVFKLGVDQIILRTVAVENLSKNSQKMISRGVVWILLASLPVVVICAMFSEWIAVVVFNKPNFSKTLSYFIFALPMISIFMVFSCAFQGLKKFLKAIFFLQLGVSLVFILLTYISQFYVEGIDSSFLSITYTFSAFLTLVMCLFTWYRQEGAFLSFRGIKDRKLWKSSRDVWISTSMSLVSSYSGVLIAGVLLTASEFSFLISSHRVAALVSFGLIIVNTVSAPKFSTYWRNSDTLKLREYARFSTRLIIGIALSIFLVLVFFPQAIMSIFGKGFEETTYLLMIIATGQFINAATGSVGFLLNMTGFERDMRNVCFFSGILSILVAISLTMFLGIIGAAISIAFSIGFQNLLALYFVKKRLGFYPIG